jgi:thiamine biosynthesis lipoprotein
MTSRRKTNRRQFLKGQSALEAIDELSRSPSPSEPSQISQDPAAARGATYLIQVARPAMACEFAVFLNAGQHPDGAELAVEALDLVERLEDQMTVYRSHSEVSRINREAADKAMPVERRLFELLAQALDLHQATHGAFDITSTPLSKVWGFYRRAGRIPTDAELGEALRRVGSHWLELDRDQLTIRFHKPGIEINLGGIGKGYALDRCAEFLQQVGVENFLIHGGQSSVLARGARAIESQEQNGWTVGLRHPLRPDRRLAEFYLQDRALGTSGTGTQSFHHKGRRYGHILDPRNGHPAEGVLCSTVIAPSAALADALATACYVMGVEQSLEFCQQRPELSAVIVTAGARSGTIDLHSAGLEDNQWRRLS